MTQTGSNRKPPSPSKGYYPTLVYLCGGCENNKIRSSVQDGLSRTCFVRTSILGASKESFKDNCYAITNSSVFVFVLDNESVFDAQCLSLLGIAIAFDVPVVGVREAGYGLPYEVFKLFAKTEIVDRSKPFEYKMNSRNLPSVTTLASALKVVFAQSVIYHERIKQKCIREITDMLDGVRLAPVTPRRIEHNDVFFNTDNNSTVSSSSDPNNTITPNSNVEISNWPQQQQQQTPTTINGGGRNSSRKTPEQRKPLGPSPPEKKRPARKNSKKNIIVNGNQPGNNNYNNSDFKIHIHSPEGAALANSLPNTYFSSSSSTNNKQETPKPRAHTYNIDDKMKAEKGVLSSSPYSKLRRNSSLPCIKTNYMVTSEEKRSQPVIYHFPISPRPQKRVSSSTNNDFINNDLDDDNGSRLHLSRTCSPVDFRSDDGTLFAS